MSLAEIKDELRRLTPADRREIGKVLAELNAEGDDSTTRVREVTSTDADVPAAMDAVFEKHRELLRRLAQ